LSSLPLSGRCEGAQMSTATISVLIFSKDRSFQLSECLRTMSLFVQGVHLETTILYNVSDPEFRHSYELLRERHTDVTWIEELDFGTQLREFVDSAHPYVLLCCDDSLYYADFDAAEAIDVLQGNQQVIGYHIMLHGGLDFCHPQGKPSMPPPLMPAMQRSNIYVRVMAGLEWNYPWELSSSIYRKSDVIAMLDAIVKHHGPNGISHPNKLEDFGEKIVHNNQCPEFSKAMCACSRTPIANAVVINRVQNIFLNPVYEETGVTVKDLDKLFRDGRQYDETHYSETDFSSMHIGEFVLKDDVC